MSSPTRTLDTSGLTLVAAADDAEWDACVARSAQGTFCHLAGWREIMADVLGHECLFRAAVDPDGRWVGVLPLVRMRSRLFGHHLVSVPFLNYGGPVGAAAARALLAGWALEEARRSRADALELRTFEALPGSPQLRPARAKLTVLLDLPASAEALWREGFDSKLRSQIRRPRKEGFVPRFGHDQVEPFYEVFRRNMRDLGTPVLPRALFERLPRIFGDRVVFGAVYDGARPIAAGCGFIDGRAFEMTWASSLREYNRKAPNMLLYWSFMEAVIARGVQVFNFGRCTPESGTHRFKRQWGGVDRPLPWLQWSRGAGHEAPAPERPGFRLATEAWRRLPLPVANRVGPWLSRRIPTF
ncbi:MAG TPA: FemAB family XrtA/PEP-CTERM system-associated protein [Longimicrobiales bacterium]